MSGEGEQVEGKDTSADKSGDAGRLTELLTLLIRVGNQLASAASVYELCRQAVQIGLTQFGFERMSIWLVDNDRKVIRGTYGTDEDGMLRDERLHAHQWSDHMPELELLKSPQILFKRSQAPLFDAANVVVGMGEIGAAALWNGEDVIGLMYMDNLITHAPISDDRWRIFELYASTLGHLLSLKRTESALRSNEELLNQILEILPVGVFVLAPEEKITRFNRAAQEIWELERESIENFSPEAVWVHNRRPVEKSEWAGRKALATGESILNQEVEIVKSTGTRHVLLNSGVPMFDPSGTLTGVVIVNQDITESKRHEQQLEALARLSQLLRSLTGRHGVITTIVSHMEQFLVSEGVAIILGDKEGRFIFEAAVGDYTPLCGMTVPEELTGRERRAVTAVQLFDASQQRKAFCSLNKLERVPRYGVVAPLVSESSAVGAIMIGFAEVPESITLELIGALADVAAAAIQRGQLYDEVTTQANRLDRVMESVDFGLLLLDPQRRVVLANQRAQETLADLADVAVGNLLESLAGQRLGRFLTPRSQSRTQEISTEGAIYEITTVPVGASGEETGWLMVIHDVTHERAIQSNIQQNQRLAAVGQLAAGIAHDFNNIIAVIMLYVQMLQRNPQLQEADKTRLNVIREQAQNAGKLIRQIMDFSRQTVIERQPVDLKSLVQECLALWERTLPESIAFTFESELEGAVVLGESSSLQQALTNLAVNARDAMPNGGELRILLRGAMVGEDETPVLNSLKRGRWFELYVIDSGMGIATEHLPHIFDPFFTTKEIGKGTGLGLAQVYGIIQQHGGMVTAQSEVGKGTSFCLFLPALTEDAPLPEENESPEPVAEGSETILLVEDNAPAREATKALLEMMGYRVYAAADGVSGLELFHRYGDSIQLVLSDLVMPEMGGLELYGKIRSENTAVCMLMMTGYHLEDENQELTEHGLVEWLQKPFTVKQLTVAVRRVLERAKRISEEQEETKDAKQ